MTQLVVFGHSITHGYWDTEGGWVQRLRNYLDKRALEEQDEKLVYYTYELGVGGDTVTDLLDRFKNEMKARYEPGNENIVLFQIGGNDFVKVDGEAQVSEEEFEENLRQLLVEAKSFTENVLLVGDGFVGIEGKIPYDPEREISDEGERKAHEIRKKVAREEEVPYVSVREEFSKDKWLEMLEDGIHPSNEGHENIYLLVREKLEEEGLIS